MSEITLLTERLDLVHLSPAEIVALYEEPDDERTFAARSFTNPHRVLMDSPGPLRWRVPQVRRNQLVNKWFVRFMVLRETREVVGATSFHGPPTTDGTVEIGYEVHPFFRRRGLGTEALIGMWTWAVQQPEVRVLRYTTACDNVASQGVIRKVGFQHRGVQIDELDGPEDIFEMSAEEFRLGWLV